MGGDAQKKTVADSSAGDKEGQRIIVQPRLEHRVYVSDRIPRVHRRFEDAFEAGASAVGIVFVLILSVYAQATTAGVEEDFRAAFDDVIGQILFLPLSVVEGLFVIVAPVMLVISLARRGNFPAIVHTVLTALAAAIVGSGLALILPHLPVVISARLMIPTSTGDMSGLNIVFLALVAMATEAGTASSSRSVKGAWVGIWVLLFFSLIRGTVTLPGLLITVLFGRLIGCGARWVSGFNDQRAMPADLVHAALDVGLVPTRIVRSDVPSADQPLETWMVTESAAAPDYRVGEINPPLVTSAVAGDGDTFVVSQGFAEESDRNYQMWREDGPPLDLHVVDPETGITSLISDVWRNIRLRGVTKLVTPSVKVSAERAMLTAISAADAGVRTPRPVSLADAGASIAVFWQTVPPGASLMSLKEANIEIPDALLEDAWRQLQLAHLKDVCHLNIDEDTLLVDQSLSLWMLDWSQGSLGSSNLAERIDCAQMLVYQALATSPKRAVEAARRTIPLAELLASALALQNAVLPPKVRARASKTSVVDDLRDELSKIAPTVKTPEPIKLERFSPRTVVMFVILAAALVAVFGSMNFDAVVEAVSDANLLWILVAFGLGTLTWVGAAIPLVAFAPKKISLKNATLTQIAASVVTLVAPAGIGPAALNLRLLNREKLSTPVAIATVTLVQLSQVITSLILLLMIVAGTGAAVDVELPTMAIVGGTAAVATVVVTTISIPKLRKWIWAKVQPSWDQAYPQFLWILGHPKQLLIAISGNLLMNLGYIGAFGASLAAFGYSLTPLLLAITYLASSTVGSVIPTPGGIGPVEAALTGGLQVAGIPAAVALSTAVVFRLVTFYGRIPFGWFAMKNMEKKGLI